MAMIWIRLRKGRLESRNRNENHSRLGRGCQGGAFSGSFHGWVTAVAEDGTFKSADELRAIYFDNAGVDESRDTIAYCRIGERSSHTWFVLKYLLGLENVKNYDGSWTEYGNVIRAPIVNETKVSVAAATA